MKKILLTILGTIIFFGGAYFMGNYALNTFNEDLFKQIVSSLFGIMLWGIIAMIASIIYCIYRGVCSLDKYHE